MSRDEFYALYNPHAQCVATYRRPNGDRVKGLVLDDVKTSLAGVSIVDIDSMGRAIPLADIEALEDTGRPWIA